MSGYVKAAMYAEQLPQSLSSSESPIRVFGLAKVKITEIFDRICDYLRESESLICETEFHHEVDHVSLVKNYCAKVSGIVEILQRNCMKVVFFGRTSNGKSTVINAMLKSKILPSGIGHTTNCFVQVEGSDQGDAFIITENAPDIHQNIQSVSQLAHALSKVRLDPDSLVRICWPKDQCHLLKEDVVFVDSPGIDVSPDLDQWIDKFCLDADVFVLVVNAESTLMQTEKNFFHHVASRLSKPNIFVLYNRWDASATEPDTISEVRQQHLERAVSFLCDELSVLTPSEAEERVFFISALETLDSCSSGRATPSKVRLDGWESRRMEFNTFQQKFGECISQSAMTTKFTQHATNGVAIVNEITKMWNELHSQVLVERATCCKSCEEMQSNLDYFDSQQKTLIFEMEDEVKIAVNDVHHKMFLALTDEVKRLSRILEEFDRPFQSEMSELVVYKKELCFHVEECLSRNLHVRCYGFIQNVLHTTTQHLQDSVSYFLTEAYPSNPIVFDKCERNEFEMTYHLDCAGLLSDFHEDIEFRFSLGLSSVARRLLGPHGPQRLASYTKTSMVTDPDVYSTDSLVSTLSLFTSIHSGTTVGTLAVVAIITKSVGWKVIMLCTAAFCIRYVYERVTWTVKAKEAEFKRQFIEYASSRLNLVVGIATENCSSQVERELVSVYEVLKHKVNATKGAMQDKLESLQESNIRLGDLVDMSGKMRSRAELLASGLSAFINEYLSIRT